VARFATPKSAIFQQNLNISLVEELNDDVAVIGGTEDRVILWYLGDSVFFSVSILPSSIFFWLALDSSDVDDLHCNFLLDFVISAAVAETSSYEALQFAGVVLNVLE